MDESKSAGESEASGVKPGWGGHQFYKCPARCPNPGVCQYCDGGLAYCVICGGFEGTLLDQCPGIKLTAEQHDWNYMGNGRRERKRLEELVDRNMSRR